MDLSVVRNQIAAVTKKLITVRTGTVVSNHAPLNQTLVRLDNDDSETPVAAQALNASLGAGTRVSLLANPMFGLLVLGPTDPAPPLVSESVAFTYTGNSTFTAANAALFRSILIETRAGGGAGGGAPVSTAGNSSGGGGGGGGGYARRLIATSGLIYPLQVNVGALAAGVSGAAGTAGNPSSVVDDNGAGTVLSRALGGGAGQVLANGAALWAQSAGALGGSFNAGDFGITGGQGFRSARTQATTVFFGAGGQGGLGGQGGAEGGAGGANAADGQLYGGGGAGAHATNGNGPFVGGDGAQGIVTILGIP